MPFRPVRRLQPPVFLGISWQTAPFIATRSYICAHFLKKSRHINGLRFVVGANITEGGSCGTSLPTRGHDQPVLVAVMSRTSLRPSRGLKVTDMGRPGILTKTGRSNN